MAIEKYIPSDKCLLSLLSYKFKHHKECAKKIRLSPIILYISIPLLLCCFINYTVDLYCDCILFANHNSRENNRIHYTTVIKRYPNKIPHPLSTEKTFLAIKKDRRTLLSLRSFPYDFLFFFQFQESNNVYAPYLGILPFTKQLKFLIFINPHFIKKLYFIFFHMYFIFFFNRISIKESSRNFIRFVINFILYY